MPISVCWLAASWSEYYYMQHAHVNVGSLSPLLYCSPFGSSRSNSCASDYRNARSSLSGRRRIAPNVWLSPRPSGVRFGGMNWLSPSSLPLTPILCPTRFIPFLPHYMPAALSAGGIIGPISRYFVRTVRLSRRICYPPKNCAMPQARYVWVDEARVFRPPTAITEYQ